MAIGELLRALEREAAAEVAALAEAARADAAQRLRAGAERRADRRRAELARCGAAHQVAADAALADAGRRGQRDVLVARAAALERVRAAVADALPTLLDGPDRDPLLDRMVAAVLAATGDAAVVRCPPALVAAVRARVGDRPGVRVEADPAAPAGLLAERDGGRVVVDATLRSLLDRWWPRLRLEVRPVGEPAS